MTNLIVAIIIALIYGQVEKHIYNNGYNDESSHFLNTFSYYYHIPLFIILLLLMWVLNILWFTPTFMLVEDISFHVKNKNKKLDENSWVNFKMGGFNFFGQWIPYSYLLAIVVTFIFYNII